MPDSTAERLLHETPCPVAVVPKGYRTRATPAHLEVGCPDRPCQGGDIPLLATEDLAPLTEAR